MTFRTATLLWVALSIQLTTSACSTPGPKPDPVEQAFSQSKRAVVTGVDEGFDESESVERFIVQARLNPCRCEAPRYEIYAHGRWTRVFVEGDEALVAKLDNELGRRMEDSNLAAFALKGSMDGEESTTQGVRYPVFEVETLEELNPGDNRP
jgi:hypothetical protein